MSREINMEMAADRANSEVNVYGAVGAVFLFLMVALILGLSFNSPCKSNEKYLATSDREQVTWIHQSHLQMRRVEWLKVIGSWLGSFQMEHSLNSEFKSVLTQPPVIYTEQLAREMDDGINLLDPHSHFISSGRNIDQQS